MPHTLRSARFRVLLTASMFVWSSTALRGNLVLRWEYLRGSTVFLVWNMSTLDESRPGAFSPIRDLRGAFGGSGTHVFMVKVSHRLSR